MIMKQVGRVEATIRKVALASTYALLKAGSIKVEVSFCHAIHLEIAEALLNTIVSHYLQLLLK